MNGEGTAHEVRVERVGRVAGVLALAGLALVWEVAARFGWVDARFLPPASLVLGALGEATVSGEIPRALGDTLRRAASGYGFACLVAIPLGLWMGRSRLARAGFGPLVEILRPIPSAAIIPVAMIFLGIDDPMKIAVIFFGSLWPILLNTVGGVQGIDPVLIETGRTFHLGPGRFWRDIVWPAASPSIATGLRISLAIALILAITVEMIAGGSGLGYYILDCERGFQYPRMYAGVACLGAVGFVLNAVFLALEDRFLHWARRGAGAGAGRWLALVVGCGLSAGNASSVAPGSGVSGAAARPGHVDGEPVDGDGAVHGAGAKHCCGERGDVG